MNEKLLKNINHYGVNHQQRKLQEEVFELQEAITNRELHWNYDTEIQDIKPYNEHLIEEIADVQVLLNQFKLYYGISDEEVKEVMIKKIDRQMERIGVNE